MALKEFYEGSVFSCLLIAGYSIVLLHLNKQLHTHVRSTPRFSQGDLKTVAKPIWNKKTGLSVSITYHSCRDGNNLIIHSPYWS